MNFQNFIFLDSCSAMEYGMEYVVWAKGQHWDQ